MAERMTVLITGSSRGLGSRLAMAFARNNYNVVIHGRNKKLLEEVEQRVKDWNVDCDVIVGHLSENRTLEKLAEVALERHIEVFINNAGVYFKKDIMSTRDVEIREIIETNLIAPILLTKRMLGVLNQKGGGTIININSVAGKQPNLLESVYCASKHGLRGFTSSMQRGGSRNVQIIDVYPGAMKTDMSLGREDFNDLINPAEVADAIFALCQCYKSLRIMEVSIARKN